MAIGPCIRACCYEVGDEVRRHYGDLEHDLDSVFVGHHLDLVASNRAQAEAAGVTRILDCGLCTSCRHSTFYSYRRKQDTGRQWMLAGFR